MELNPPHSDEEKAHQVGLYLSYNTYYGRSVFQGVSKYQREHERWKISVKGAAINPLTSPFRDSGCDGIIGYFVEDHELEFLEGYQGAVVNIAHHEPALTYPTVTNDDYQVGGIAGEYLWDLGYEFFAYCGDETITHHSERRRGFEDRIMSLGGRFAYGGIDFTSFNEISMEESNLEMRRWMEELPKPIAILASSDAWGTRVLDIAHQLMYPTPGWVSVIGVGNDGMICEMARPPLTSIELNFEEIGYEAAAMLDRQMQGSALDEDLELILPTALVERESTDVLMG